MKARRAGQWATIPALVLPDEEDIAGLYRRMVDENVIRKDLSFAEMAHAAQNYAADPATEEDSGRANATHSAASATGLPGLSQAQLTDLVTEIEPELWQIFKGKLESARHTQYKKKGKLNGSGQD